MFQIISFSLYFSVVYNYVYTKLLGGGVVTSGCFSNPAFLTPRHHSRVCWELLTRQDDNNKMGDLSLWQSSKMELFLSPSFLPSFIIWNIQQCLNLKPCVMGVTWGASHASSPFFDIIVLLKSPASTEWVTRASERGEVMPIVPPLIFKLPRSHQQCVCACTR